MQVKLKVYSENSAKNEVDGSSVLTKKVSVREFGGHVEQMHANGNSGFREEFFVSGFS